MVGVCKVASAPYGDETALNPKDDHFDPKATKENPIWLAVDMQYVQTLKEPVTLQQIKNNPKLSDMLVAQRGEKTCYVFARPCQNFSERSERKSRQGEQFL